MKGYVYIGYDESSRYFKIGKSNDVSRREREIRNMNPTFRVLCHAPTENQDVTEKALHEKYASKRIIGEWFDLSPKDIQELTRGKLSVSYVNIVTGKSSSGNPPCLDCGSVMDFYCDATDNSDFIYFCERCEKSYRLDKLTCALYEER